MATKSLGLGDKVHIVNTRDPNLDGLVCCVVGFTARYHNNDYVIVMLPNAVWMDPYNSLVTAIQITDACLEVVARAVPFEGEANVINI